MDVALAQTLVPTRTGELNTPVDRPVGYGPGVLVRVRPTASVAGRTPAQPAGDLAGRQELLGFVQQLSPFLKGQPQDRGIELVHRPFKLTQQYRFAGPTVIDQ